MNGTNDPVIHESKIRNPAILRLMRKSLYSNNNFTTYDLLSSFDVALGYLSPRFTPVEISEHTGLSVATVVRLLEGVGEPSISAAFEILEMYYGVIL